MKPEAFCLNCNTRMLIDGSDYMLVYFICPNCGDNYAIAKNEY